MSHGSERDEEPSSRFGIELGDGTSILGAVRDRYEVPALLVIVAAMLWIRLQSYSNFVRNGEVYFSGNDAWYHLRSVRYVVRHWPWTMPFDPWTNFPEGTFVGQFGTLYDQIVATAALIVGLGSPSADLVAKVLLVTPAVAGALTAVPTYLLGKRLAGRVAGLFGAVVLMLLPGTFLRRTLVGFADHNGVEPVFQVTAVLALAVALAVAQEERPIWELVTAREWDSLRRSTMWSAIAGLAVGLYIWVWPPGVLLLGIFSVYIVLQVFSDYGTAHSPDHVAFVAGVSMTVTAVVSLLKFQEATFSATKIGFLHTGFALAIAVTAVGLAWLARQFEAASFENAWLEENGFRAVVSAGIVFAIVSVISIDAQPFGLIRNNLLRFVGFSAGAQTRTIGEAQPWLNSQLVSAYGETGVVLSQYGFAFVTALIGAAWSIVKPLYRRSEEGDRQFLVVAVLLIVFIFLGSIGPLPDLFGGFVGLLGFDPQLAGVAVIGALVFAAAARVRYDAEALFVFVWAAFLTMAAFTQVRFNYYLAVAVAVLNAYFIREVLTLVDIDLGAGIEAPDVETYQVIAAVVVVMIVLVPVLTVPIQLGPRDVQTRTVMETSQTGPGSGFLIWDESLDWVEDHTPREGTFGGADNEMTFYGQYQRPADSDFEYPDGAYGVQSWWDYGHWITMRSERIPNANPFQEGAAAAANFLLAPNESAAREALLERGEEADDTRYVMIDYKMASTGAAANSKFFAPIQFYDASNVSTSDFVSTRTINGSTGVKQVLVRTENGLRGGFTERKQRYYESMMIRLYMYHGSRAEPRIQGLFGDQVVVFDYQEVTDRINDVTYKIVTPGQEGSPLKTFPNRTAAEEFVAEDGSARIGGVGAFPREPVAALEHYRLVDTTDTTAFSARQYQLSTLRQAQILGLGRQRAGQLFKTTPSWVKTFERVPGATVTGSGADPNETLTASVRLQIPADSGNGTSFVYRQQTTAGPDGEFSFTVPYSTTGYEEFGPENGYTNVTVRAMGPYQISGDVRTNESGYVLRNGATLNVSEADVNGAGDGQVDVTLSESVLQAPQPSANETGGNETVGNETAGNETAGNETIGGETAGNETVGNETTGNESTLRETPFGGDVQTTGGSRHQAAVAARAAAGIEG